MKTGLQIIIQKDLTANEKEIAVKEIDKFISDYHRCNNSYASRGGRYSMYKRNVLGYRLADSNLYLRRMSTKRRIFGIVKLDNLYRKDGGIIDNSGCFCGRCSESRNPSKIKCNLDISKDFDVVYEFGDIKG